MFFAVFFISCAQFPANRFLLLSVIALCSVTLNQNNTTQKYSWTRATKRQSEIELQRK